MREGRVEGHGGEGSAEMCTTLSTGKREKEAAMERGWMLTILMQCRVWSVCAVVISM